MPYIDPADGQIHTLPRNKFFNLQNPGFYLFMNRGSGIFLRINNILFMHGQLFNDNVRQRGFDHNKCEQFNRVINENPFNILNLGYFNQFTIAPQLHDRDYGSDIETQKRMTSPLNQTQFCTTIIRHVTEFFGVGAAIFATIPPERFKIVIGHCTQYDFTYYNQINRTFTTITPNPNGINVVLTPQAMTFQANPVNITNNNVFGITMECPTDPTLQSLTANSDQHHRIYKVDVGVSRAFDVKNMYNLINNEENMKRYLLSRVPQVLVMQNNDVRIVRSTVKNVRIHQYRHDLERIITAKTNAVPPAMDARFDISNNDTLTFGGYKEKYLKYKQKYLSLKEKLNK
jgi:hypothetical protein